MSTNPVILGFDIDSSKFAVAVINTLTGQLLVSHRHVSKQRFSARLREMVNELGTTLESYKDRIRFVGIEDYGHYHQQNLANDKAEIIGSLKYKLLQMMIPMVTWYSVKKIKGRTYINECSVGPKQRIKFLFGRGDVSTSGKSGMLLLKVYKTYGIEFSNDDQADAYIIALMTLVFYKCLRRGVTDHKQFKEKFPNGIKLIGNASYGQKTFNLELTEKQFDPIYIWLNNQTQPEKKK